MWLLFRELEVAHKLPARGDCPQRETRRLSWVLTSRDCKPNRLFFRDMRPSAYLQARSEPCTRILVPPLVSCRKQTNRTPGSLAEASARHRDVRGDGSFRRGPHALVRAALLPERVLGVVIVATQAPLDAGPRLARRHGRVQCAGGPRRCGGTCRNRGIRVLRRAPRHGVHRQRHGDPERGMVVDIPVRRPRRTARKG